jgi:hypothetical protein
MLRWKLWYADGTAYADADGPWADAPGVGVQALIVEDDDTGWTCEEGSAGTVHNYVWWPGADRPWGVDHYGTLDYLVAVGALEPGAPVTVLALEDLVAVGVKVGRSIDTPAFEAIAARARADDYFPAKSALRRGERPPP